MPRVAEGSARKTPVQPDWMPEMGFAAHFGQAGISTSGGKLKSASLGSCRHRRAGMGVKSRIQDYTQSNGKWPSLIIELLYQFSQGQIALNRRQGDLRFKFRGMGYRAILATSRHPKMPELGDR